MTPDTSKMGNLRKEFDMLARSLPAYGGEFTKIRKKMLAINDTAPPKYLSIVAKDALEMIGTLKGFDLYKANLAALALQLDAEAAAQQSANTQIKNSTVIVDEQTEALKRLHVEAIMPLSELATTLPMAFEATGVMWQEAGDTIVRGLEPAQMAADTLAGSINGLFYGDYNIGESLTNAFKQLASYFAQAILKALILKGIMALLGLVTGGVSKGLGGAVFEGGGGAGSVLPVLSTPSLPIMNAPMQSGGVTVVYQAPVALNSQREVVKDVMGVIREQQRKDRRYTK